MSLVIPIFVRGGEGEQGSLNFRWGGGGGWPVSKLIFLLVCFVLWLLGILWNKINIKELSFPYFFNHCEIQ